MITAEEIREELKKWNTLITIEASQALDKFIAHKFMSSGVIAPVLYQLKDGTWIENEQAKSGVNYLRKGRLMFVEDIPQPVPVLELAKVLDVLPDPKLKEYARRLLAAGFES